jgi:hypothetical protein
MNGPDDTEYDLPTSDRKVQPRSRVPKTAPGSKFEKLQSLRCFAEVRRKVIKGFPIPEIAMWVQEDQKEYLQASRRALEEVLRAYRTSLPVAEVLPVGIQHSNVVASALRRFRGGVDELKELEELYSLQRSRIDLGYEREMAEKKTSWALVNEVRAGMDLLSRMASLKMDLGIHQRKLGTLDVATKKLAEIDERYGRPEVAAVVRNPESRRKVLSAMEHVVALLGSGTSTAVVAAAMQQDAEIEGRGEVVPEEAEALAEDATP